MGTVSGTYRVCSSGEATWAGVLDAAIVRAGYTLRALADHMSVAHKTVERWRGASERIQPIPLHRVASLPPAVRRPITEALAALDGCTLAELPTAEPVPCDVAALGDMGREFGEALASYSTAIADRVLDAREVAQVRRELADVVRLAVSLDHRLASVERNRVEGVRLAEVGR